MHLKSSIRLFANDIGDIYEPLPPAADINGDNTLNIQDLIALVNLILLG